jgi:hypothetical protein
VAEEIAEAAVEVMDQEGEVAIQAVMVVAMVVIVEVEVEVSGEILRGNHLMSFVCCKWYSV